MELGAIELEGSVIQYMSHMEVRAKAKCVTSLWNGTL
jgi:hypothetical protein